MPYTNSVWESITRLSRIQWPRMQWNHLLQWATSNYRKRKNILHIIARLSLSTTVYYIWFERNNRIFTSTFHPPQHTSAEIIQLIIRSHLENMGRKNPIPDAIREIWNMHP
jgi:hypothetical protein